MGEKIAFRTTGGYLATPDMGAGPAVIVIPERRSAARHARDLCDRFAAEGFTALAPEPEEGHTAADLVAAIDTLEPHPAVRGQGVGVVGFDVGAGLALWLGMHRPDAVVAVVPFYGLPPINGSQPPDWSRLSAAVQGHFGEDDPTCPPEAIAALEEALGEAGVSVEMFTYPTAGPGCFDDSRSDAYDEDHARQAWIRTLEFLRKQLG
jgi:carboxymethylenebutenolidase